MRNPYPKIGVSVEILLWYLERTKMSTPISQILKQKLSVETGYSSLNKTVVTNSSTEKDLGYWNDTLFTDLGSLCNPLFRSWYCNVFYKLGKDRVLGIASEARLGRHPQRYFSYLLKEALNQKTPQGATNEG